MLLNECVVVKWNPANKKYYVEKGYKYAKMKEPFMVLIKDVTKGCNTDVMLQCDYCGKVITQKVYHYLKESNKKYCNKDACIDCANLKNKEVLDIKYGVKSTMELDYVKEKTKHNNIEKYGKTNPMKTEKVKQKLKNVFLDKYGVEHYSNTDEFKEKFKNTCLKKYGVTSYLATDDCQNKAKNACFKKYGVKHYFQTGVSKGANNCNWKGGYNHHLDKRKTPEYRKWRTTSFKRDDFTCQCCKNRGGNLRCHHIFNWKDNEGLRFNVNNAITLCDKCHKLFHHLYGNKNTNDIQLNEFLNIYGKNIV